MKIHSKDFEPLKHQLCHPWPDTGKSSKSCYKKKAREMIFLVFSIIAPGQENVLLNAVQSEADVET